VAMLIAVMDRWSWLRQVRKCNRAFGYNGYKSLAVTLCKVVGC